MTNDLNLLFVSIKKFIVPETATGGCEFNGEYFLIYRAFLKYVRSSSEVIKDLKIKNVHEEKFQKLLRET